jgi:hypothetical protein
MPQFILSNRAQFSLANADMPLTGTFYGQLMTSGFTFNPDTHDTIAAISSGEITPVTGYSAGGKPVTLSNSMNTTTGVNTLLIAPVQWEAAITGAQGILIYYRPTGSTASQQIVLGYNHLGSPQASTGGLFRVEQMKIETAKTGSANITIPHATINAIINETFNLSANNFYAMLLGTGYTPSAAHSFRSDLTSEVTGTGYTAGGVPAPLTITRDDAANVTLVRAEQIIHPACTVSPKFVAYYQRLGGAATADRVLMIANFGTTYPSGGAVYVINGNWFDIAGVYV